MTTYDINETVVDYKSTFSYQDSVKHLNDLTEMLKQTEGKDKQQINLYHYLHKLGYDVDSVIDIIWFNNSHLIIKENLTELLEKFKTNDN